jgi:hypothetical protein
MSSRVNLMYGTLPDEVLEEIFNRRALPMPADLAERIAADAGVEEQLYTP